VRRDPPDPDASSRRVERPVSLWSGSGGHPATVLFNRRGSRRSDSLKQGQPDDDPLLRGLTDAKKSSLNVRSGLGPPPPATRTGPDPPSRR